LHDRERFDFCSSRSGIRVKQSVKLDWVGRVSSMGGMKNSWGDLVEKPEVINWDFIL
jgi:hypothetical protein